jgi:hypothetical protein
MTRYAVTGPTGAPTRPLRREAPQIVRTALCGLSDVTEFTTGGAYDVDTIAALAALNLWEASDVILRLALPVASFNRELLRYGRFQVEYAIRRGTPNASYMARNDLLVSHADVLLAFPRTLREEQRSGTWSTIRRARIAGVEVRLFPLDGSDA